MTGSGLSIVSAIAEQSIVSAIAKQLFQPGEIGSGLMIQPGVDIDHHKIPILLGQKPREKRTRHPQLLFRVEKNLPFILCNLQKFQPNPCFG